MLAGRAVGLQTVVIVDGLENLDAATVAAEAARPSDILIYSVFGITECQDIRQSDGSERHVHWFSGNATDMLGGVERRRHNKTFGGFLYATPEPEAEHVIKHCRGLLLFGQDAKPDILKL